MTIVDAPIGKTLAIGDGWNFALLTPEFIVPSIGFILFIMINRSSQRGQKRPRGGQPGFAVGCMRVSFHQGASF
jgi:hypothetical protein